MSIGVTLVSIMAWKEGDERYGVLSNHDPLGAPIFCIYDYKRRITTAERFRTMSEADDRLKELNEGGG